jgi:hypothetical protein
MQPMWYKCVAAGRVACYAARVLLREALAAFLFCEGLMLLLYIDESGTFDKYCGQPVPPALSEEAG